MPVAWKAAETIQNFLSNKNVQELMDFLGETPTPLYPAAKGVATAGLVMNPKNAKRIQAIVQRALIDKYVQKYRAAQIGKTNAQITNNALDSAAPVDVAIEYIKAKYPKLASLPDHILSAKLLPSTIGEYSHGGSLPIPRPIGREPVAKNVYRVGSPERYQQMWTGLGGRVRIDPSQHEFIDEMVDTLGHELVHAKQYRKDPIGLTTAYWPMENNFSRYYSQPWESEARQGGRTARETYDWFIRSLMGGRDAATWPSDLSLILDK